MKEDSLCKKNRDAEFDSELEIKQGGYKNLSTKVIYTIQCSAYQEPNCTFSVRSSATVNQL